MTELPSTGQPSAPGVPTGTTSHSSLHRGKGTSQGHGGYGLRGCGGGCRGAVRAVGLQRRPCPAVDPAISTTRHLTAATSVTTGFHPTPHPGGGFMILTSRGNCKNTQHTGTRNPQQRRTGQRQAEATPTGCSSITCPLDMFIQ